MFDIGFWELALIAVVALLVIGPERLPGVARNVGMWVGKMRRFVSSVQADINAEVSKADELKHLLEEQSKLKAMHEIIEETSHEIREGVSVPAAKPKPAVKAVSNEPESSEAESSEPKSSNSSSESHGAPEKNAESKHGQA
jgi:sec-independent protein translocase protein TatB